MFCLYLERGPFLALTAVYVKLHWAREHVSKKHVSQLFFFFNFCRNCKHSLDCWHERKLLSKCYSNCLPKHFTNKEMDHWKHFFFLFSFCHGKHLAFHIHIYICLYTYCVALMFHWPVKAARQTWGSGLKSEAEEGEGCCSAFFFFFLVSLLPSYENNPKSKNAHSKPEWKNINYV